jgi:hypothetical protein
MYECDGQTEKSSLSLSCCSLLFWLIAAFFARFQREPLVEILFIFDHRTSVQLPGAF